MTVELQRFLHEDLERLEQGISDRLTDEPRNIRQRLNRDHQIASFLGRIHDQSARLLDLYADPDGARAREIQDISTGDPFAEFYRRLDDVKDFHRRYPNEPVENLEKAYRRKEGETGVSLSLLSAEMQEMFSGEEAYGKFFDLTTLHQQYLNLPDVKHITYLQYLDVFDRFTPPDMPVKKNHKFTQEYTSYVHELAAYLESFIKKVKPLMPIQSLFQDYNEDFEKKWAAGQVPGWERQSSSNNGASPNGAGTAGEGDAAAVYCADCDKSFKNDNVYKNHLTGKKHIHAAQDRAAGGAPQQNGGITASANGHNTHLSKERAIAEREHRISSLAATLKEEREATRVNVERKQGMTERERQMELEAILAEEEAAAAGALPDVRGGAGGGEDGSESEEEDDRIYNPLKLPLAWDGKPIPYWLYKLHGLGVELPCEICGNFVYMGRRAFDKHFSEARHIYGLKCLGITSHTGLFREITRIEDAMRLWEKLEKDRKREREMRDNVVQMEDAEGNVMPERIYLDLQKQGIL